MENLRKLHIYKLKGLQAAACKPDCMDDPKYFLFDLIDPKYIFFQERKMN